MSDERVAECSEAERDGLTSGLRAASCPMAPATWGWLLALAGWTVALSFYHLDGGAGFEPIDCWVAQTAREMHERGDWLIPVFSGETRMQKSPGPYWAVMLTSTLLGRPIDEVTARIPNAMAALALVITIFWLTRRIAGDRAAIFAGFATASSGFILLWSHRGASDLGLATFTTISLAALWVAYNHEPPGRKRTVLVLLAYFSAGLGMLYKMPMPIVVVGLPAFFYIFLRWKWRILASPLHLLGLLLFALPWLPWALLVLQAEPIALAKWKVEFVDRYTGALPNVEGQNHWRFLLTYIEMPLVYCLPYTLSLPGALWRGLRRDPRVSRDGMLCMVIWFAALLAFFTSSTGKEWRYFLVALPPLFVLLGVELSLFFDPRRAISRMLVKLAAIATIVGVPAGFAGAIYALHKYWWPAVGAPNGLEWSTVWQAVAIAGVICSIGTTIAAVLFLRGRRNTSFAALVGVMWATWLWVWPNVMPLMVTQREFVDLADQMNARLDEGMVADLHQIGSQDPRITWYGNIKFPRLIDQLELLEMQGGERSLRRELELYVERMVAELDADDRILLIGNVQDYIAFLARVPAELAARGMEMPDTHLWLVPRAGRLDRYFVVFSNHAPPWDEPELPEPLQQVLAKLTAKFSGPATQPASSHPDSE